tara:strand:+ start:216 stop:512 length:297 start_codon:yes stop_codon:yes gene_type:complete
MSIAETVDNKLTKALSQYDWLENGWSMDGNNPCESKLIKGVDWELFYPNSQIQYIENEEWNTFSIGSYETNDCVLQDVTFEELVKYVKENAKNFGWEK